jgi:aminobenzoyl-glutamate utilization protein B
MNESIPPELKREGLRKSKLPDWEKMVDQLLDERVLDPWDEGEEGGGSTDVADVSWNTPTLEFTTACCMLGTPGHSWQFVAQSGMSIGHKGLIFASKVIATSGLELLRNPALLKAAQDEWKERMGGKVYKSPLPADLKPPLHQLEK